MSAPSASLSPQPVSLSPHRRMEIFRIKHAEVPNPSLRGAKRRSNPADCAPSPIPPDDFVPRKDGQEHDSSLADHQDKTKSTEHSRVSPGLSPGLRERLPGDRECFLGPRECFLGPRECFLGPRERFLGPRECFLGPRECFLGPRERFLGPRERFLGPRECFLGPRECFLGPRECFLGPRECFLGPRECFLGPRECFLGPRECFLGPRERFLGPRECLPCTGDVVLHAGNTVFGGKSTDCVAAEKFFPVV